MLIGTVNVALLARALFPQWTGIGPAVRAGGLFAFGGAAMSLALSPEPVVLSAALMPLLILALVRLDGERMPVRSAIWSAVAGVAWGTIFLSQYSTLVFLPILVAYVGLVSGRNRPLALAVFLAFALALLAPVPLRAVRATGNPLFHPRLLELVMQTSTYPDETLYHLTAMPRSIPAFLADGGAREVVRKVGKNLFEYLPAATSVVGPILSMMFLGAGLIRFTDPRLNRLRGLAYALVAAHLLGLALFFSASPGADGLFVHAPAAAILGAGFLEVVVRARRLPKFHTGLTLAAWIAVACAPGLARYWTGADYSAPAIGMFDWLATSDPEMRRYEQQPDGVIGSDIAPEVAFRHGASAVFLPADSVEVTQTEKYLGKRFEGFFLSPDLAKGSERDETLQWWRETQTKIVGYWGVLADLPAVDRSAFSRQYQLTYPGALSESLTRYRPLPIAEGGTGAYSLVFWYNSSQTP